MDFITIYTFLLKLGDVYHKKLVINCKCQKNSLYLGTPIQEMLKYV